MLTDSVKINLVKTDKEWDEVRSFGLTFNHELLEVHKQYPLFAVRDLTGKLISFMFIKTLPMAFCAWGPEISPRQVMDSISHIKHWNKVQSELQGTEQGYVAVDLGNKQFTPEVMDKIGFDRVGIELYTAKE